MQGGNEAKAGLTSCALKGTLVAPVAVKYKQGWGTSFIYVDGGRNMEEVSAVLRCAML